MNIFLGIAKFSSISSQALRGRGNVPVAAKRLPEPIYKLSPEFLLEETAVFQRIHHEVHVLSACKKKTNKQSSCVESDLQVKD